MDMTEFMEGKYLTVDLVEKSKDRKAYILTPGIREQGKFGQTATLMIDFNGIQKQWSPNKQSVKCLSDAWGVASEQWVGKRIEFTIEPVRNIKTGELTGSKTLIARPSPRLAYEGVQIEEVKVAK